MPKQRPPRLVRLRESAATAERAAFTEAVTGGAFQPVGSGRMLVQLISKGWGSSGYYAAHVLEHAARERRFPAGLHLFMNHPGQAEEQDRPERDVRDLAAVLSEDARYDPARQALVAEVELLPTYDHLLRNKTYAEAIGLSIRAGGLAEHGTAEGRDGIIVTELTEAHSVDFVTRAGRGGKVLALLESARARLSEAPTEQTRTALDKAIGDAYSSGDRYAWVRDWDPARSVVWFDLGGAGGGTWEQSYLTNGADVALIGARHAVQAVTVYRPVMPDAADPDTDGDTAAVDPDFDEAQLAESTTTDVTDGTPPTGSPNTPEEESAVAETQTGAPPVQAGTAPVVDTPPAPQSDANVAVVEALRAMTTQITSLTEANANLSQRLDQRDAADQTARNRVTAREAISTALASPEVPADLRARISPRVTATVLADIPLAESGDVDDTALAESIRSAIDAESGYVADLLESAGVGRPRGLGAAAPKVQTVDEFNTAMTEAFKAIGLDERTAAVAGKGRS